MAAQGGMIALVTAALVAAIFCGVFAGRWMVRHAGAGQLRRASGVGGFRMEGVRSLRPVAKALMGRAAWVRRLAESCLAVARGRGMAWDAEGAASVVLAGAMVAAVVGFVAGNLFWGAICAGGTVAMASVAVSRILAKEEATLRGQVPDVLRALNRCLQSGMTLAQTFAQIGRETDGQLGELFTRGADMLETGSSTEDALALVRENTKVPELAFLAMALDVQHQTGGSMEEMLETAMVSVNARLDLSRHLETQTAQARLSAHVVTILPFALLAVLSLMSPGFLDPLCSGPAGSAVLMLAALLQIAGILMVRRILGEASR